MESDRAVLISYSALRLSVVRFFVVCRAERGTPQKICGLGN